MGEPTRGDTFATRASIFVRLKSTEAAPREMAWEEFRRRYAPIVAGFARNLGAGAQDVDDIIQDVFLGFFAVSPRFQYDPAKGRFRGYLKTVTLNAIRNRFGARARLNTVPLTEIADDAQPIEQSWDRTWQEGLMRRALQEIRDEYTQHGQTFEAFVQYVLRNQPAAQVAKQLDISIDSVYQAKHRVTEALRERIHKLQDED